MNSDLEEIFKEIQESKITFKKAKNRICKSLIKKFDFAQMFEISYEEIIKLIKQYFDVEEKK